MAFAKAVCEELGAKGYWADYLDPCSGLTVWLEPTDSSNVFSLMRLLVECVGKVFGLSL